MRNAAILLAAGLPLLGACATDSARLAERAQKQLIGATEAQILACAGQPIERAREGGNSLLVYYAETAARVDVQTPAAPMPIPMPEPQPHFTYYRHCEVSFVLIGGRVQEVRMKGRTDTGRENLDACGKIVQRCMAGR